MLYLSQGLISNIHLLLKYGADGAEQVDLDKTTVLHHLATCKRKQHYTINPQTN